MKYFCCLSSFLKLLITICVFISECHSLIGPPAPPSPPPPSPWESMQTHFDSIMAQKPNSAQSHSATMFCFCHIGNAESCSISSSVWSAHCPLKTTKIIREEMNYSGTVWLIHKLVNKSWNTVLSKMLHCRRQKTTHVMCGTPTEPQGHWQQSHAPPTDWPKYGSLSQALSDTRKTCSLRFI